MFKSLLKRKKSAPKHKHKPYSAAANAQNYTRAEWAALYPVGPTIFDLLNEDTRHSSGHSHIENPFDYHHFSSKRGKDIKETFAYKGYMGNGINSRDFKRVNKTTKIKIIKEALKNIPVKSVSGKNKVRKMFLEDLKYISNKKSKSKSRK